MPSDFPFFLTTPNKKTSEKVLYPMPQIKRPRNEGTRAKNASMRMQGAENLDCNSPCSKSDAGSMALPHQACQVKPLQLPMVRPEKLHIGF